MPPADVAQRLRAAAAAARAAWSPPRPSPPDLGAVPAGVSVASRLDDRTAATVAALLDHGVLQVIDPATVPDVAAALRWAPPGHFYSPIPGAIDAAAVHARWRGADGVLPGISLAAETMLDRLRELDRANEGLAPSALADVSTRYRPDNAQFGPGDAWLYRGVILQARPRRVVEIGSGHSTALLLDTVEAFSDPPEITLIEPYPDRLLAQLLPGDGDRFELRESGVEAIGFEPFAALGPGDVLFIDSTHVVRPGSDVVIELLEIVPRLPPGVHVHVHDVVHPFEIPPEWLEEGRIWCESYLLRGLLTHNRRLNVDLSPHALDTSADPLVAALRAPGVSGTSMWLRTA